MGFHFNNIWLSLVPLVPNLFFFTLIKLEDKPTVKEPTWLKVFTVFERISQALLLLLPLFFTVTDNEKYRVYSLAALGVFALLYYIGWMRFNNDRRYITLFKPLLFIPLPLALFPVLYFISVSVYLNSVMIFAVAVIFAVTHIPISIWNYKNTK